MSVPGSLRHVKGGVCVPVGYRAAGVKAGIKSSGAPDLALLVSDRPASAAGLFTKNLAAAAPVQVSRERIKRGQGSGVVVNSGCANACTGKQGLQDATDMAEWAANAVHLEAAAMMVCSTGHIGSHLPMEKIRGGVQAAAAQLGPEDEGAALAIMTTDTGPKRAAVRHPDGWSIGGIAKGAGMIAPDMATMLAFLTCDAHVESGTLQRALEDVVQKTFNAITVDGDTSTNDTVLAFANGASGITATGADIAEGLEAVCSGLARMIVADGEGTTKVVSVYVTGALDARDARLAVRAVAESNLVKTALYGEDANWGRVVAALGRSGASFHPDELSVSMAGVMLYERGTAADADDVLQARAGLAADDIELICDLGAGRASAQMLSTDLSPGYVALNAAYES